MKNVILVSALAIIFSFSQVFSFNMTGKTSFMPENKLKISIHDKFTNDMTKERFDAIINRVYLAYSPIVLDKKATLQMESDWEDDTVNAYAYQSGSTWYVSMFGGLARHPLITDDGFLLVVCHETAHHVGGAPKYSYETSWASNEGQSDYFGALKCMKRIFEKDDNVAIIASMNVDVEATRQCQMVYKNAAEAALCQRIAMAGKSLALLLASLDESQEVAFDTPDTTVVNKTIDYHPNAQCRLDTYFSGALCDKPFTLDVSDTSPNPGTCMSKDGYLVGARPLCWFKPDVCVSLNINSSEVIKCLAKGI